MAGFLLFNIFAQGRGERFFVPTAKIGGEIGWRKWETASG